MSTCVTLQTQVVSILEVLAKSAILEISKVIYEGTAVLHLEISQSKKENETLKWKLLQMEKELQADRRGVKIRPLAGDRIRSVNAQDGDDIRGAYSDSYEEERSLSIDSVFGKEWSIDLWKDGELTAKKEEEAPLQPVINEEATQTVEDRQDLFPIKMELFEENLEDSDTQGGLKITGGLEPERDSTERQHGEESDPLPASAEVTEEPYTQPAAAGGRLEEHTLPVTMEGTAEPHTLPAPPESTAGSEDARPYFLRGALEPERDSTERQYSEESDPQPASAEVTEEPYTWPAAAGGRLEQHTLPVTMEGTAEPHTLPAPPESTAGSEDARRYFLRDSVFGKEWSIDLWKNGELTATKKEEAPLQPVINEEATQTVEDRQDLFPIKMELFEENLEDSDTQGGLKITGGLEPERDSTERQHGKESDPQPASTEVTEEPYTQPAAAGGRLEQHTLPVTMEGTAEPHTLPAPPESTAGSEDARRAAILLYISARFTQERKHTAVQSVGRISLIKVASIMEVLAKSAVAEICKAIDEGTAVLRLEMSQSKKENDTLKWRLLEMEKELLEARKGGKNRVITGDRTRLNLQVIDEIRGVNSDSYEEERSLSIDSVFGKEWSIGLWKDGELTAKKEEEAPLQPVINEEATQTVEDRQDLFPIKVELFEENLEDSDPQGGLHFSGGLEPERDSTERQHGEESDPQPASTEVASIMEVLAKSAVVEISKAIDEGTAVLRFEMSRSKEENETLKWRLLELEKELMEARRGGGNRAIAHDSIRSVKVQVGDEIRSDSNSHEERSPSIDSVYGKEWSIDLWKDGELTAKKEEEAPLQPVINRDAMATQTVEDRQDLLPIKVELFEVNLEDSDPQGGLKISVGLEPERDSTERQYSEESDPQPVSTEVKEEPFTRPTAAGGRLEQHTLPVTMEGTAEPRTLPAPPESTAGSEDARRYFFRGSLEPERDSTERQYGEESDPQPASTEVTEEADTRPAAAGGRLEQHTLSITMEGTAESHTPPAPPESTAGSEDARRYFLCEERSPSIDSVFGKEWSIDLWKDGELTAKKEEEAPLQPVINRDAMATQTVEDRQDLFPIKVELFEENLQDSDPQGGLKISGGLEPERDSTERQHGEESDPQPASTEVKEEPFTRPTAAGGRLEEHTLPVTMEGTAEPRTLPAPPESTAGSEDARRYFFRAIDEGTAVLLLEMSRSKKENETLKWRLLELEKELLEARRGGGNRATSRDRIRSVKVQVGDEIRGPDSNSYEERSLSIDSVFGKEWSIDLWKDGELTANKEKEAPLQPVINRDAMATQTVEDRQDLFPIKVELFEENLEDSDPQGGLKTSVGLEPERDSTERQHGEESDPQPVSTEVKEEPFTRPTAAGGRLEQHTLPVTMDGTAEPHTPPAPPESTAGSEDARRYFFRAIDEGTALLLLEMSQSKKENETLKWRLLELEKELLEARRGGGNGATARDRIRSVEVRVGDEIRGPDSNSYEECSLSIDSVFGKEWSIGLWKDGELTAKKEEEAPLQAVINRDAMATQTVEDRQNLFPIKMELFEENLQDSDPQGGLKISGGLEPERDSTERQHGEESDPQPASTEVKEEPYTQPAAAGGRLEQHTLPVTMEGTAEPHTLPAPPESTAGSEDARLYFFRVQPSAFLVASIMEVLAESTVVEIGEAIDEGTAVLRLEMSQSKKEKETLKWRLLEMEKELLEVRRGGGNRANTRDTIRSVKVQVGDEIRGPDRPVTVV
ncbi:hypothetical protein SKAU_G00295130 [Synaphobranchus kaupii]|uniref:Uncharacterized protein n=1 Tax=Synaphobranchus kaupii TaxID=118154 RepID=A0A9Q1EUP6_SYNKA|nr:hypothetical protein SKAU_G00295130 [Synaphobranchus kaupii]